MRPVGTLRSPLRAPVTTRSPGASPDTIAAETRFIAPTFTVRSSSAPFAPTTRTIAGLPAKRVRG